jgi:hypothetical protein
VTRTGVCSPRRAELPGCDWQVDSEVRPGRNGRHGVLCGTGAAGGTRGPVGCDSAAVPYYARMHEPSGTSAAAPCSLSTRAVTEYWPGYRGARPNMLTSAPGRLGLGGSQPDRGTRTGRGVRSPTRRAATCERTVGANGPGAASG